MSDIKELLHVGISVYNMKESLEWYEKNFGFKLSKEDGFVEPLGATICFMEKDGFEIELFEYKEPKELPEIRRHPNSDLTEVGTKHMAFRVDDMDAVKEKLVSNGVEIVHEAGMGGDKVAFIRDCNGILIELIQKKA